MTKKKAVFIIAGTVVLSVLAVIGIMFFEKSKQPTIEEILEPYQTETAKHYYDEETGMVVGRFEYTGNPIQYRDEDGKWRDIDTTIKKDGKDYAVKENVFKSRFGGSFDRGVDFEHKGGKVRYLPVSAEPVEAEVEKNRVTYKNAWKNTDVEYQVSNVDMKMFLRLHDENAPDEFRFRVTTTNGTLKQNEDGTIDFVANNGNVLFSIPQMWVEDSSGTFERHYDRLKVDLEKRDEEYELVIKLDDADLVYPIVIDPTTTLNYTGSPQTWTVPSGVTKITIDSYGAEGGTYQSPGIDDNRPYYGGKGGRAKATFNVSPGQVLYIYVGERGLNPYYDTKNESDLRAWNGGGLPKYTWEFRDPSIGYTYRTFSGGGGGASDVRLGGQNLNNRIIVAGGGGGGGKRNVGGAGGGLTGGDGGGGDTAGNGGTQTAGGSGGIDDISGYSYNGQAGSFGQGGDSANKRGDPGGGGGGWYGGGGGSYGGGNYQDGGGGGGSGYISSGATNTLFETGVRTGHGLVIITYNLPPTKPTITSPAGGEIVDKDFTIRWNASTDPDGDPITYKVHLYNGSTWVSLHESVTGTSLTYNFSSQPETTGARIRVQACDNQGGCSEWAQSNVFTIRHNQPPSVPGAFTSPTTGSRWYESHTITWGASTDPDGDPVTYQVEFFDGSAWKAIGTNISNTSMNYNFSNEPATSMAKLRVRACDNKGACSDYRESGNFTINKPPGAVSFIEPTAGMRWSGNHTIRWNHAADPNNDPLQYFIELSTDDGVTWKPIGNTTDTYLAYNFSQDPSTSNAILRIRAFDGQLYGNWVTSGKFIINRAPSVMLVSPLNNVTNPGASQVFTWEASDPDGDRVKSFLYVDGALVYQSGFVPPGQHSATVDFSEASEGGHTWYVIVEDEHGERVQSETRNFKVEKTNYEPNVLYLPYGEVPEGEFVRDLGPNRKMYRRIESTPSGDIEWLYIVEFYDPPQGVGDLKIAP